MIYVLFRVSLTRVEMLVPEVDLELILVMIVIITAGRCLGINVSIVRHASASLSERSFRQMLRT
jgi:hypothetical protein